MKFKFLIFLTIIFCISSCNKDKETKTGSTLKDTISNVEAKKDNIQNKNIYELTHKNIHDFISKEDILQYDAEGDLNNDGLSDVVLVLRKKTDTLAQRKILIVLKNHDKTYTLDKISDTVLPLEYADNGYQIHYSEEISIKKGKLQLHLFGMGASGNLFSDFQYFGKDLVLTYLETYNVGAGSWLTVKYDVLNGKLEEEVTNTMKEDMPSETKEYNLKKEKHLFETTDPESIMIKAYEKVSSNS